MRLKLLICSVLCMCTSFVMTSCDPNWALLPSYGCSLVIDNTLGYPVSMKTNFDIQNGSIVTVGEEITHVIDPHISPTLVLVHYRYLGRTHTPFEDIWKHNGDEPVYFLFYRLNPETYEEEEAIADWGEDSIFFEERSWYKEYGGEEHYDEDNHSVDFFKLTFSLADNL